MNGAASSFSLRPRAWIAGSLLALAAAASLTVWAAPGGLDGPRGGPGHHAGPGGPDFMVGSPRQVERLLDEVKATEAQRTQIRQIAASAATDLKAQRESGKGLRDQQLALFAQPVVDANAAEVLRQQMLAQHDQSSKRVLQAVLEVSRVLTPEQRGQLAERMQRRGEMMKRHMQERQQLDKQTG
jgi:Spy/CpxP family protein refolding chaperone